MWTKFTLIRSSVSPSVPRSLKIFGLVGKMNFAADSSNWPRCAQGLPPCGVPKNMTACVEKRTSFSISLLDCWALNRACKMFRSWRYKTVWDLLLQLLCPPSYVLEISMAVWERPASHVPVHAKNSLRVQKCPSGSWLRSTSSHGNHIHMWVHAGSESHH